MFVIRLNFFLIVDETVSYLIYINFKKWFSVDKEKKCSEILHKLYKWNINK